MFISKNHLGKFGIPLFLSLFLFAPVQAADWVIKSTTLRAAPVAGCSKISYQCDCEDHSIGLLPGQNSYPSVIWNNQILVTESGGSLVCKTLNSLQDSLKNKGEDFC